MPNPPGIPAGGIFRQATAHSSRATAGVLSLDPVAVDLSPSSAGPGVAAGFRGGQPSSLAAQAVATTLHFGAIQSSLKSSPESTPRTVPIVTAVTPGQQRAELPDIPALAP
ncbi:MAG TPA: hypothetical protein VHS97_02015, partial [Isosphaeraceae bacterium]|nr:hypothetical protein [Isosphaeraceae bacterium]